MIAVYIASPYTKGDVGINVRASFDIADLLLERGFAPYPPLYSHFWHIISPKTYETWMMLDTEWVKRCDCVLRVAGESRGANAEVELALSLKLPVFYSIAELVDYWKNYEIHSLV